VSKWWQEIVENNDILSLKLQITRMAKIFMKIEIYD